MNARRWKLYRRLTKATYGLGILFLLVGMVLSMVNQPVSAASFRQDENPNPTEAAPLEEEEQPTEEPTEIVPVEEEQPTQEPTEVVPTQEEPGEVTPEPTVEETEVILTEVPTEVPTIIPTESSNGKKPDQGEWGKSSLSFSGGCTSSSCYSVSAQVCNVGDGDMTGSVSWELYYAVSGNPKNGDVISSGSLGPLDKGECTTLSYNPNGVSGNYMFRAEQEAGHPGTGELWSSQCSVGVCEVPTSVPTFTPTPLPTVTPVVEGKVEFTSGDSALCQYNAGWIDATVRVTLPEGVTGRLQTSYYIVNPPDKRTSPTYAVYSVTNGDEITVSAYWPGVSAGDEVVEIHWGARLSVLESGIDNELSTDGLDFYWYPWVCGQNPTPTPVPVQEITVTYLCTENGLAFNAANPNNFEFELNYSLDGSPAVATIPASSNLNFVTTQSGAHTLDYEWNRGSFTQSGSITTPSNVCGQEQPEPGQLVLSFECAGDGINWIVTNPNDFPVTFDWSQVADVAAVGPALLAVEFSSGGSGTDTVPANSSLTFYKSALGSATIQISYVINEEELGTTLTNGDEYCRTQEITPTPSDPGDPTATPTPSDPGNPQPTSTPSDPGNPQPTPTVPLFAPQASSGNTVLIPVTGADLTAQPSLPGSDFVRKLLTNLGLFFLGTAFVMQSVTNKFRQP